MKGKSKKAMEEKLSEEDFEIVADKTIPSDLASLITGIPIEEISKYRYSLKYRSSLREASRRYREKLKKKRRTRTYSYWTEEEIDYIMYGTDTDVEMAKKLDRSVYSIQKKRERETNKRLGGKNGRNNKKNGRG